MGKHNEDMKLPDKKIGGKDGLILLQNKIITKKMRYLCSPACAVLLLLVSNVTMVT